MKAESQQRQFELYGIEYNSFTNLTFITFKAIITV